MNKLYQYSHIFLFLCSSLTVVTAQRTICASGVTINVNGTPINYNLKGSASDEVFVGAPYIVTGTTNFGEATTLNLTFARQDINRAPSCSAGAVDNFEYRVYRLGDTPPAFTSVALTGDAMDIGVCSAPNNFFKDAAFSINLLALISQEGQFFVDFRNATSAGAGCTDTTATYTATFFVGALTLRATSLMAAAACGDTLEVAILATSGFSDLSSLQYSLSWTAGEFQYLSHTAMSIGGSAPIIGTDTTSELSFSWIGSCTTLPDGDTLLKVRYLATGCISPGASIEITGVPLALEAYDCDLNEVAINAVNNVSVNIASGSVVTLSCPADATETAGQTQAAINAAFSAWINSFGFSGGCFPVGTFNIDTSVMPSACGDTIVAIYTVTSNCALPVSCTRTFIAVPVPQVSIIDFGGSPFNDVCVGDTAVFRGAVPNAGAPAVTVQTYFWALSGTPQITPAGAFGGDGTTQRRQEAVYNAGSVGMQTVNLTVTYTNGCVETAAQHTIMVHALPVAICPADTAVCADASVLDLTTLTPLVAPTPGVFSGSGVSGTNFDPSVAGVGVHTIIYAYTNANNCTDTCSFTITVDPVPSATIIYDTAPEGNCASGATVCSGEPTDLTFVVVNGDSLIVTEIRHELESNDGDVCAPGASSGYGPITGTTINVGDNVAAGIVQSFVNNSGEKVRVSFRLEPRSGSSAKCVGAIVTANIVVESAPELVGCLVDTTLQTSTETTGDCLAEYIWLHPTVTGGCAPVVLLMSIDGATPVAVTPGDPAAEAFNKGDHSVEYLVTDAGSNIDTCSFGINVVDNEPPTITCPVGSPFARNTDAGECNYTVLGAEFNPTFFENCPGAIVSNSFNNTASLAGADLPKGSTTVTWTITDGMNMASTNCMIVITVTDSQPPTITCPSGSPFARNTDPMQCNYTVLGTEFDPTFGDNCTGATISNNFNNTNTLTGADLPKGSTTIVWTVTDAMAMSSTTCSIVVEVTDNQPPTITCPVVSPFARNTDVGQCNYTVQGVEFDPIVFDDNCSGATITNNFNNSNTLFQADLPKGSTTIVWTVTDAMAMTSTNCSIVVNVTDNQLPTITCPTGSPFARNTDPMQCNYTVLGMEFDPMTFGDNCSGATISNNFNNSASLAGADLPKGSTTIVWTVTDGMAMTSTNCSIVVTVTDNQPPTISCAAGSPFARNTDPMQCNYTVLSTEFDPTTFGDNCPGATISNSFNNSASLAGADLPKGVNTITWTVTDGMNMTNTNCVIVVNVTDNQMPTITCPAGSPFARNTDPMQCNYTVLGTEFNPTFGDNCPGATIANSFNNANTLAGADLPKGSTTIVWTVTDAMAMSSTTCSIVVEVADNQPPTITCPAGSPFTRNADVGECTYTVLGTEFDPTAGDNCPMTTLSNDYNSLATLAGAVLPSGDTSIVWMVTAMNGDTATCVIEVTVQNFAPPVITCPNPISVQCGNTLPAVTGEPTVDNDCNVDITYVDSDTTGTLPCVYSFTRTFTATDPSNNTDSCTQIISVQDTQAPKFTVCPINMTVECGSSTDPMITGQPAIMDSCDLSPVLSVPSDITVETPGPCEEKVITRTWYAVDHCFNSTSCVQTITVDDTTPPTLTCPASLTIECGTDTIPGLTAPTGAATATDNCGPVTVSHSSLHIPVMNNCPDVRLIFRTWTATDACGNVATCSVQNIIIRDTTAPVLTNPAADKTVECDGAGNAVELNAWLASNGAGATATDVCGNVTWSHNFTSLSNGCGASGSATVTFTATDGCAHTTATVATFTVVDTSMPTWVTVAGALDVTLECSDIAGLALAQAQIPVATDNCADSVTNIVKVAGPFVPGNLCPQAGTYTNTWTATDSCGNNLSTIFTQIITVTDTTPPMVTAPATIDIECSTAVPAAATDITSFLALGGALASDNCTLTDSLKVSALTGALVGTECAGSIERMYRITDACGNATTVTQIITVTDNTPPTAVCQNVTVELDNMGMATLVATQVNNNSTDNCGNPAMLAVSPSAFTCANVGVANNVVLTVTDSCANADTCHAIITVNLPGGAPGIPTVVLSQSASPVCSGDSSYTLTLTPGMNPVGTTYDVSWVITPAFGTPDPNLVTLGGDFGGISGNGLIMATEADLVLTGPIANLNINSVNITFTVTPKFGPCSGTPQTIVVVVRPLPQVTSISPNPPVGVCSGSTVGGFSIGHNLGSFGGDPSNSIVWTWSGTSLTATPANGTDNGGGSPNALFVDVTTLNNTGATATTATLSVIPQRTTTGLTCSGPEYLVQIVVEPEPEIICPNDISATTTTGCDTTLAVTHPVLNLDTTNCPVVLSISFGNGTPAPPALPMGGTVTPGAANTYTFALGQTVVTYSVVDGAMNTTFCSFKVNVADNDAPVITCPSFLTIECNVDTIPGPMAPTSIATATDNCAVVSLTHTDIIAPGGLCPQEYIIGRVWTARDAAGNSAVCTQGITVDDSQPPSITCPADTVVNCGTDTTTIFTGIATALDNCSPTPSIGIGHSTTITPGGCPQAFTMTRLWRQWTTAAIWRSAPKRSWYRILLTRSSPVRQV
jgi:hypothetical protein